MMTPSTTLLVSYARYHRDPRNIATHYAGIPLIIFAIGVLLWRLQFSLLGLPLNGAVMLWALAAAWYLYQGVSVVTMATIAVTGLLVMFAQPFAQAALLPWLAVGLGSFVVGWAFQLVGHVWEGRKPAFVDDIRGLLVGPMFVTAEVWFVLGGGKSLRDQIDAEAGPVARQTPRPTGQA